MPFSPDLVFLLAPIRDDFISGSAQGGKLHPLAGTLEATATGYVANPGYKLWYFPQTECCNLLSCFMSKETPNILDLRKDNLHYRPCFRAEHHLGLALGP